MMMKEEDDISKIAVNTKNIKKLQNDIIAMIRQMLDLNTRPQEAAKILEGLIQTISSSQEKWHLILVIGCYFS
ncbi:MAG: hypothetical protein ACJ702_01225 [Nitrososphaeraceae archaeon]